MINLKKAVLYILLTFAVSWTIALSFFALGGNLSSPLALPILILYMFVPMSMAIIVQKGIFKEQVVKPLGISFRINRWFAIAWVTPVLVAFGALGVALLFPGVDFSPGMEGLLSQIQERLTPEQFAQVKEKLAQISPLISVITIMAQGMIAGVTINAVAGFGEELGWRGFLQRELAPLGFWGSSLAIGIIWGLWHAPIIWHGYNYPQHPYLGVVMMTIFTTLLAPLISYIRLRAKSVIAAAVMHGTINGTVGISFIPLKGGSDLTVGLLGAAGCIALLAANIVMIIFDRKYAKVPIRQFMKYEDGARLP